MMVSPVFRRLYLRLHRMGTTKVSRWWGIVIGSGIALSPIHNQWLTEVTSNAKGETLFFLPAFGYLLIIMGAGLLVLNNWQLVKASEWGDRRIVGCLLFIVLAIAVSGSVYDNLQDRFAPMGMGVSLFALYLSGRILGKELLLPLAIGSAIASLGVIVHAVIYPGIVTGGYVFEMNYDIVVGYILLGAALFKNRWQWLLAGLSIIAMLLTGSPEGAFVLAVIGIAVLIRKDWGRKIFIIAIPIVVLLVSGIISGYGQELYSYAFKIAQGQAATPYATASNSPTIQAIGYRIQVIKETLSHIRPLGEGYNLTDFSRSPNVHNVPLVIVQQLGLPGIMAGMAWLWVSLYCLIKTKWIYVWILVLALSVWDHFIWTQMAPYWWIIVGYTTANNHIGSDLIFKDRGGSSYELV